MPKTVKIISIAVAGVLALLAVAVGIIAATFDPNDYKPQIIQLVQEKKQRTLAIPGQIKLTFFPKIGADLGQVSISEHASKAEFAAVNHARVSLQLIPLFSKKLIVDQIEIDGLRAHIKRYKDGSTNFDDLLAKDQAEPESGEQFAFDIASISITNANVDLDDRQQNRTLAVSGLNLETGKIANGADSDVKLSAQVKGSNPDIDAKLAVKTGFLFDLEQNHYVLKGADASLDGRVLDFRDLALKLAGDADLRPADKRFALEDIALAGSGKRAQQSFALTLKAPKLTVTDTKVDGGKIEGEAKLVEADRTLNAEFSVPSFEGTPQAFKIGVLALDARIKQAQLDAKVSLSGALAGNLDKLIFTSPQLKLDLSGTQGAHKIAGALSTPLAANLQSQIIELPNIAASFSLPNPAGGVLKLDANGRASADLGKQNVSAALKGKLDQSVFDARLGLASFSPPSYTFDIGIDQLDADRYRSKDASAKDEDKTAGKSGGAAGDTPIDLSALRTLNANGSLRIGNLKVNNLKTSNVRVDVRAAGGTLNLNPVSANLYGGSTSGAISVSASNPARFNVRQNLSGVNVGPLLKDAIGKAAVEGHGSVQLKLSAAGNTVGQIKKGLNGTAALQLKDGAVRGFNIAQIVRGAKAKLNSLQGKDSEQSGTSSGAEKTDFSELSGSFKIANGVARNDDLSAKSPLIRVAGAGTIDIGADRLDYLVKATVVSTLKGQGGPELEALKGLTIPVRLSGPFSAIGWKVDAAGLAKGAAKEKLEQKKDEVREKAKDKLKDQLKGFLGR